MNKPADDRRSYCRIAFTTPGRTCWPHVRLRLAAKATHSRFCCLTAALFEESYSLTTKSLDWSKRNVEPIGYAPREVVIDVLELVVTLLGIAHH